MASWRCPRFSASPTRTLARRSHGLYRRRHSSWADGGAADEKPSPSQTTLFFSPSPKGRRIPGPSPLSGVPRGQVAGGMAPEAVRPATARPRGGLAEKGLAPSFPSGPGPIESWATSSSAPSAPFTVLFVTWTVPDLGCSPARSTRSTTPHLRRSQLPRRPRRDDRRLRAERHQQALGTSRGTWFSQSPRVGRSAAPCASKPMARRPTSSRMRPPSSRSALRSTPAFRLLSRSTLASLAPATPASLRSSTR